MNTSLTTTYQVRPVSNKENKMNPVLINRKALIVVLAVLALLVAAAAFVNNQANTASTSAAGADAQYTKWENPEIPNPRVRFAALDGKKIPPAALDGKRIPPAALDGRRTPATLDGSLTRQMASLPLVDSLIVLALAALLLAPARKAIQIRR